MKLGVILCIWISFCGFTQEHDFPVLEGPYLGQKPPGLAAELFAPGIISTLEMPEMCAGFTADGKEFFYNAQFKGHWTIFQTREIGGQWINPEPMLFSSGYTDRDFTISPDGQRIYFGSNRPREKNEEPLSSLDIYVTERIGGIQWSEPKNIGSEINSDLGENYPSVASNGNLYFFSSRGDGSGGCDIYVSRYIDGRYHPPENIGSAVNSVRNDWDAFIAPDESYIIFSSQNRDDTIGGQDLYISFQNKDGSWTVARNMGPRVNSKAGEICPSVSLDGQYLFFTSRRRGQSDIFWVDAGIIEEFKPVDPFSAVANNKTIVEAAKNGDLKTVKTILELDPSMLNAKNQNGYTALHWACMRAHWDTAKYLIEKGADLNVVGGDGGTQINWAVHHDNVEIIKLLVENGAKLNIQNKWGMSELHTAIWRGNINVVRFLLDQGSDPDIKTNEGWTAMHYAYRSGHDNIIEMLKKRGLSMTEKDNMGRTPQYLYFKKPNAIEMSKDELDLYVGKYYIEDYLLLEIWREGDRLKIMEFGPDEIYPVAKDFFYFKHAPWTLIFSRDGDGRINHAQLSFIRRSYTIVKR